MSTATIFNGIVDALITKTTASATYFGSPTAVVELDEHPAIPASRGELPKIYVIPVVEDGDDIDLKMGGPECWHNFSISVVGYYLGTDTTLSTDLRTTRNYGYLFLDMFRPDNRCDRGQIYNARLDCGYWVGGTVVVHYWVVKLKLKASI